MDQKDDHTNRWFPDCTILLSDLPKYLNMDNILMSTIKVFAYSWNCPDLKLWEGWWRKLNLFLPRVLKKQRLCFTTWQVLHTRVGANHHENVYVARRAVGPAPTHSWTCTDSAWYPGTPSNKSSQTGTCPDCMPIAITTANQLKRVKRRQAASQTPSWASFYQHHIL